MTDSRRDQRTHRAEEPPNNPARENDPEAPNPGDPGPELPAPRISFDEIEEGDTTIGA